MVDGERDARLDNLEMRMTTLEGDVASIKNSFDTVEKTVVKIWRAAKYVTGAVLPTLVAAGYVNGTFADILQGIFGITVQ